MDHIWFFCISSILLVYFRSSTAELIKQFPDTASKTQLMNTAVDNKTGNIFLGSVNWLYVLNSTLHLQKAIPVGPKDDNLDCAPDPTEPCEDDVQRTAQNSTVMALAIDYRHGVLIACSDRYYGYCFKVSLRTLTVDTPEKYIPIISNKYPPVLLVGKGCRSEGVLYVGTTHGNGLSIYKDRVPMLAVRELDGFNIAHVDQSTASTIDILPTLRPTFEVHFIHAFIHGQYTYFLIVRREDEASNVFKTKVVRICHKDERFRSYIEMPLECEGYNLLQDAYVARPGKNLAKSLGISLTDDVIFATFAESADGSRKTGPNSAVCLFSMDQIADRLLSAIKLCFAGQATIGPPHITQARPCIRVGFQIDDDYCMEADHNHHIYSTVKCSAKAKYPVDEKLTSIAVKITSDLLHTLVVLGTADGRLTQSSIEDDKEMVQFSEENIGAGLPIHKDMLFDNNKENIYATTEKQISKVSINPDCSLFKTCGECLGAGDTHCGWCTMEGSCMRIKECSEADNVYGWLPYNHVEGCPAITEQNPSIMQYQEAASTMIVLSMNFIPLDLQMVPLKCLVETGEGRRKYIEDATLDTTFNKIVCDPFQPLPNLDEGQASLNMKLSVLVYSKPWISTNVTFYDCNQLDSCATCAMTNLPCDWCLEGNQCLPESATCLKEQYSSLRIRRQAAPTAVAVSPTTTEVTTPAKPETRVLPAISEAAKLGTSIHDPAMCPIIKSDKIEFLTPAGYTGRFFVNAQALRDFQRENLKCNFDIGSGIVVNATQKYDSIKRIWKIDCSGVKLDYKENEPFVDVPFDISWDSGKFIDNPSKIHVRVFKCSAMEGTCGLCSLLDPIYKCGWCENKCLQREPCTSKWLPRNETCPNAQITDFSPRSGSVNGGTNITVKGINLGKVVSDLTSVTVAGIPCKVMPYGYVPSQSFICTAGVCSHDQSGYIELNVSGTVTAKSTGKFTYVDPVLADFTPRRGPIAGGTHVFISGDNLDLGSKITVTIKGKDCPVVRRNFTHLEFRTAARSAPVEGKVKVTVDGTEDNILGGRFTYLDDPTVTSVLPKTAILSGGSNVTVTGRNLDSIQMPKFLVKINQLTEIESSCVGISSSALECPVPKLIGYGIAPTSSRPARLHYGFIMDGVTPLRNVSHRPQFGPLLVYPNPVIMPLEKNTKYQDDTPLVISGKDLKVFDTVDGLAVSIGDEECEKVDVKDDLISCMPPAKLTSSSLDKDGNAAIIVKHGHFYTNVGFINYESKSASVSVIIFAVLGAILLIVLIIASVFFIRREKRRRKKKYMPPPPQEERLNRMSDADRYKENIKVSADETEMVPLKNGLDTTDDMNYGNSGKPFRVEDFLERVKSSQLRNNIKEVLIPRNRLDLGEIIGKGHFGCVYAAYLRDENQENPEKVAVKTLQAYTLGDSFSQQSVELFLKEGVTMRHFNHLHVLRLLGVCFDEEAQPMVILPYMAKGDLRSYVKDKKKNFTARQLLQLARQVAEGMSYLASLNFVHRDLAARNCMIDELDQVKVADFGLSRELYEKDYYSSKDLDRKGKMPIKWMALESLEDFVFTTKSDVWSFGVLVWELMMRGVTPYPDVDVFDVRNFLASGRRLRKPKYCPDNIYRIMMDCWHADPLYRPSFTDLVNRIELMLNPPSKSPKPPDEPEQIYMNLSEHGPDYLHPVDNTDGSVTFSPK